MALGNHISEFISDGARSLSLRRLGWAFLLAWVFCVFYTSAAGGTSAEHANDLGAVGIIYSVAPVASSVVTLVAAVLLERQWGVSGFAWLDVYCGTCVDCCCDALVAY